MSPHTASQRPAPMPAEIRETHSGIIVLAGDRAYKVKKPVDLGFLDFRTEPARHRACARELELNRRLSPDVYLDLVSITGSDGLVCDHMVVMRRMPEALRLSSLIKQGANVEQHLQSLARLISAFHATAERGPQITDEGRASALRRRWTANLSETETFRGTVLDAVMHERISGLAMRFVDGREPLLTQRADAGHIVDGHGDLIAEDIFCLPDHPRILDCLEFDDRLRWVDVIDDVAFLSMDLEHLGHPELAEQFLLWYAARSKLPRVRSLEHHYVAYRAFVRAKVGCIRAAQGAPLAGVEAAAFAEQALHHLRLGEVSLTLIGGAPGTGKTTLAVALAKQTGALLLSTDTIRQELPVAAGQPSYSEQAKAATYHALLVQARSALANGKSVIADATWSSTAVRTLAREVATSTYSRLHAFECHAPIEASADRAQRRLAGGHSNSAAGARVARRLASERDAWPAATVLDTSTTPDNALRAALATLTESAGTPEQRPNE